MATITRPTKTADDVMSVSAGRTERIGPALSSALSIFANASKPRTTGKGKLGSDSAPATYKIAGVPLSWADDDVRALGKQRGVKATTDNPAGNGLARKVNGEFLSEAQVDEFFDNFTPTAE